LRSDNTSFSRAAILASRSRRSDLERDLSEMLTIMPEEVPLEEAAEEDGGSLLLVADLSLFLGLRLRFLGLSIASSSWNMIVILFFCVAVVAPVSCLYAWRRISL